VVWTREGVRWTANRCGGGVAWVLEQERGSVLVVRRGRRLFDVASRAVSGRRTRLAAESRAAEERRPSGSSVLFRMSSEWFHVE